MAEQDNKNLEQWIWDAACSIRGAQDAPKYKDFILPLVFAKRLCDVFDDEIDRLAESYGSREVAFAFVDKAPKLVRFYLPFRPKELGKPVWSVIRELSSKIGEQLTSYLADIARFNPLLDGIINRIDFNATTHGQRDLDDDRLSNLIEAISKKRLGLNDVEPDIIGRSYEYLIRKFAEGSGQSAGEFYTPAEVGLVMARILAPTPGMEVYDPTCGSGGLLVKCEIELDRRMHAAGQAQYAPLKLHGQEFTPATWAMANMNMIIHDMEGKIEIGDTMKSPKFIERSQLKRFDRVVANPMWNQDSQSLPYLGENFFANDPYERFADPGHKDERGNPRILTVPSSSADWAWMLHILHSLNDTGRAAVVLDTGAASRGSGNANRNKEKEVRKWFVDHDLIEGVLYLPENLFYNTSAPGVVIFLRKNKPQAQKNKLFLLNASRSFKKGDPKNYVPDEEIARIADTFAAWREEERFSRIVEKAEIVKNDYNISPSRYIHVADDEDYRPLSEIVEDLRELEKEARLTDQAMQSVLARLGL
ncbi:MAG: class I SAM-dependent DNA methyltransferase [Aromatoleum sp.]|jgi:type I restriction enzyme M protein|uniref:type I restriction-modification system subunit M n=1 Tax=Aromatoleum sp. TaxID=2307007 RepID=UPI002893C890|nr:class I SAM-dependent DNA methyltransferase [Aromatoleum sp.]MDT3669648.1 class I SAM-dependent DNA methyltransferase [Aromatoleum sp.]